MASPSDALALSNTLIVHPSEFQSGQHVLVKGTFVLTVRLFSTFFFWFLTDFFLDMIIPANYHRARLEHLRSNVSG